MIERRNGGGQSGKHGSDVLLSSFLYPFARALCPTLDSPAWLFAKLFIQQRHHVGPVDQRPRRARRCHMLVTLISLGQPR